MFIFISITLLHNSNKRPTFVKYLKFFSKSCFNHVHTGCLQSDIVKGCWHKMAKLLAIPKVLNGISIWIVQANCTQFCGKLLNDLGINQG
jgi:hypothetical protein